MNAARRAALVVVVLVALAWAATIVEAASRCRGKHWVGVWATSPSGSVGGVFVDRTLRLVINPTLGGRKVRVRLSNRFGADAVRLGAVTSARRADGATVEAGSLRTLRFKGRRGVTIKPGGEVVSDPQRFAFDAFADVVVSLHVRGSSPRATAHPSSQQTSYMTAPGSGDRTAEESGEGFTSTLGTWPFLTDLEVRAPRRVGAVVALGDSITDGFPGPVDGNGRYPDLLARRLAAAGGPTLAFQNEGISGNEVLRSGALPMFGPSLLSRLDADTLDQAGASIVLLMEGTNDIGVPPTPSAAEVIAGLEEVLERLHDAGLRVIIGTLPPCRDFALALHGTPEAIAKRNQINEWIRTSASAYGVVDFHAVLRDPADPDRLLPAYDSGDHLHPSAAGYAAMAEAVDLSLFDDPPCPP